MKEVLEAAFNSLMEIPILRMTLIPLVAMVPAALFLGGEWVLRGLK